MRELMKASYEFLNNHPLNIEREARGLKKANSIWIWGEGKKPLLSDFYEKYGMKGTVISAVDLIKGIGLCAGLDVVEVEGATGNVHTNFKGKAIAAIDALKNGSDYIYIHMEAPDECGHRGEIENKIKSIELIDELVVGPMMEYLKNEPHSILVMPDHPTPLTLKTHVADPVPYLIYNSTKQEKKICRFAKDSILSKKFRVIKPILNGVRRSAPTSSCPTLSQRILEQATKPETLPQL